MSDEDIKKDIDEFMEKEKEIVAKRLGDATPENVVAHFNLRPVRQRMLANHLLDRGHNPEAIEHAMKDRLNFTPTINVRNRMNVNESIEENQPVNLEVAPPKVEVKNKVQRVLPGEENINVNVENQQKKDENRRTVDVIEQDIAKLEQGYLRAQSQQETNQMTEIRNLITALEKERNKKQKESTSPPNLDDHKVQNFWERIKERRNNKKRVAELKAIRANQKLTKEQTRELQEREKFNKESSSGVGNKAYDITLSVASIEGIIIFGVIVHLWQGLANGWTEPVFGLNAFFIVFLIFIIGFSRESTKLEFKDFTAILIIFFLEMQWFNIVRPIPVTGRLETLGFILKSKIAFPLWVYFGLAKAGKLPEMPKFITWTWRFVYVFWFLIGLTLIPVFDTLEVFKGKGLDKDEVQGVREGFGDLVKESILDWSTEEKNYATGVCGQKYKKDEFLDKTQLGKSKLGGWLKNPDYEECKIENVAKLREQKLKKLEKEAKFNAIEEEERTITADLNSLPPSTTDPERIEQTHSVVINSPEDVFDLRFECELRNHGDLEDDSKENKKKGKECEFEITGDEDFIGINKFKGSVITYDKIKGSDMKYFMSKNNEFIFKITTSMDSRGALPIVATSKKVVDNFQGNARQFKDEFEARKRNWFNYWRGKFEEKNVEIEFDRLFKKDEIQARTDRKPLLIDIKNPIMNIEKNPMLEVKEDAKITWVLNLFLSDKFKQKDEFKGKIKAINNIEVEFPPWMVIQEEKCPFKNTGEKSYVRIDVLENINENLDEINDGKNKEGMSLSSCTVVVDFKLFSGYVDEDGFIENTIDPRKVKEDWIKVNVLYDYEMSKVSKVYVPENKGVS